MKILAAIIGLVVLNNAAQGHAEPLAVIFVIIGTIAMAGIKAPRPTIPPVSAVLVSTPQRPPSNAAQGIPIGLIIIFVLLAPLIIILVFAGIGKVAGALSRLRND